jgi:hypothetical protein
MIQRALQLLHTICYKTQWETTPSATLLKPTKVHEIPPSLWNSKRVSYPSTISSLYSLLVFFGYNLVERA